ncbi:MAG: sulfatase-like hydrolase/transferase [Bacteroidetes bacterium]|nr:sulfatase-like hydrolase/transferase [Bacteroidota bacterium]
MKYYYILILILIGQFIYSQKSYAQRPNILIAISDDQSYPHMSASGCKFINTPSFDRIAENGVLFSNAFVTSPGCAPSRASLVMGRYPWQNEHAGNHSAIWPKKLIPFPDLLEDKGYFIGFTGKGVEPFEHGLGGRDINPAGYEFNEFKNNPPARSGIDRVDYAENFKAFLNEKDEDSPFCFMYLSKEPHRGFELGSGVKSGKSTKDVTVPPFLPDTEEIRSDLLDYALEIEWFDLHLAKILKVLEESGELDNTIIIVTSDNGMAFPASKALCYEYGIHVPLAISWGDKITGGRIVDDLVGLIDIYPTLFEILDLPLPVNNPVEGKSMANILFSDKEGKIDNTRKAVYAGRERHSYSRWQNLGYPQRTIRTDKYLYVWNFYPERWPAGAPERFDGNGELVTAFTDVDQASGHKKVANAILVDERNDPVIKPFFELAFERRQQEELFDITKDPGCTTNLAYNSQYESVKEELNTQLFDYLRKTEDPRIVGSNPDIFESYRRYAGTRNFPEPDWVKDMDAEKIEHLLKTLEEDNEPIVLPKEIGDWGLKMGRWELVKAGEKKWKLYNIEKDPDKTKDLSTQKYRVVDNLIKLYDYSMVSKSK